jgi:hypothetical protein
VIITIKIDYIKILLEAYLVSQIESLQSKPQNFVVLYELYRIPLPNYIQMKWHAWFLTCQFVLVKSNLVEHWEPQNIQHFI